MKTTYRVWTLALLLATSCGPPPDEGPGPYPMDDTLTLFHVQAKGTHNSYHQLSANNEVPDLEYEHEPLEVQLGEQGVRQFELDVNRVDPTGPFEVFHIYLIDEETTCRLLSDCLSTIATWSAANPGHHPIAVHLEPKDGFDSAVNTAAYYDDLQAVIRGAIPENQRLTPDMVQGSAATMADAVAAGWPTLAETRGRIMVIMLDGGDHRDAYLGPNKGDGTSLKGKALFAEGDPGDAWAAVTRVDGPTNQSAIDAALAAGLLIRTRADSPGPNGLEPDPGRRDAAFASGAHFVSTDMPAPTASREYFVEAPGGMPSRCNPKTAPTGCTSEAVEDPARLAGMD